MRSPTPKQKKLARLFSDNLSDNTKTVSQQALLVKAGYSLNQARRPSDITRSQGFLKALDELGLTDEIVVSSLVEDIRLKPQRRAFELSIAAKIRGLDRRADSEQSQNIAVNNAIIIVNTPPK